MCLYNSQQFQPNDVEIELYKAFKLDEDGLSSVYSYDDQVRPSAPYERGVWHKANPTIKGGNVVGFHAYDSKENAEQWAKNHISHDETKSKVVKVTFKNIIAKGVGGDLESRAYTAMEMYIPLQKENN